jgi:hypothetical protein
MPLCYRAARSSRRQRYAAVPRVSHPRGVLLGRSPRTGARRRHGTCGHRTRGRRSCRQGVQAGAGTQKGRQGQGRQGQGRQEVPGRGAEDQRDRSRRDQDDRGVGRRRQPRDQTLRPRERAQGLRRRGPLDAVVLAAPRLSCRVARRGGGSVRLRTLLRAHDVQGERQRPRRRPLRLRARGRWKGQRLHHRRQHAVPRVHAEQSARPRAVARGGPAGVARGHGRQLREPAQRRARGATRPRCGTFFPSCGPAAATAT